MARDPGQSTGTLELTDVEYLNWHPEDSPVAVHMQLDAVDGIIRDVVEASKASPRDLEVGGLLLGRVEKGDRPVVWIERYQRIVCGRRSGPHFLLDGEDQGELEKAAANILESGDTAVVGLFRSHTREGFQLEEPDFELIGRYFSDPSDLVLLLKPEGVSDIFARFYVHEPGGSARPVGDAFPFRGRLFTPDSPALRADISGETDPNQEETQEINEAAAPVVSERPRRLIPDFAPTTAEPMLFGTRESIPYEEPVEPSFGERLRKWLPLIAALLLVGGVLWFVLRPARQQPAAAPVAVNEPVRPLGLSVEPMGPAGKEWQVSWNANATALHDARSVQLFVRERDDQNRIDLTPGDLAAGIYKYQPMGNDVTFRLEVTDSSGRISAESFRYEQNAGSTGPQVQVVPPAPVKPGPVKGPPPGARARTKRTEPKVTHRAPPVIAAGIRSRIKSTTSIDVRVHIDERGRVTSAAPVVKPHQGLESYLAASAVQAAKLWRFEPARENGQPVPGTQTIHFVFEK
jgi:TonB family protein